MNEIISKSITNAQDSHTDKSSYESNKNRYIELYNQDNRFSNLLDRQQSLTNQVDLDKSKEIQKINQEVRDWLDKEALVNEAKTILYEKLEIDDNKEKNTQIKNFLKWVVDELVIWNYELAIEIYNTKWKIILDTLRQLATWQWIKKLAISLWESIWDLFVWDAYEKWKSVTQLWLISSGTWLSVSVWKKWLKLWIRELASYRLHKENIVINTEIKWVITETTSRVDNIIPKKELDFESMLVDDIVKLWDQDRLEAGSTYLQRQLNSVEQKAILDAHKVWDMSENLKYNFWDLRKKYTILKEAGLDDNDIRILMEKWICGKDKLPSFDSLYSQPKYSFLEQYKEILWENISIDDIVWEWTQAIIMRHPTNENLVIKIAKPGEVDDIMQEFKNHNLFYEKWKKWIKKLLIDDKIKIPKVQKWESDWYFFIEKVDWQSLYSKTLIDRYIDKLNPQELEQIWKLADKQVREFLKKKFDKPDSHLDQIIEDYSTDYLSDLLWLGYKYKKETWKIWWTPLDNAIKTLRTDGISHNDLHSGNIMIGRNKNIYIIDFWRIKEFNK